MLSTLRTLSRPLAGRAALLSPNALAGRVVRLPAAAGASTSRPITTLLNLRRLRNLEEDANRNPSEPTKQLALMQACNDNNHAQVAVRRFESGSYASDEAVVKEYVRSLALSNQLGRVSLAALARSVGGGNAAPAGAQAAHDFAPEHILAAGAAGGAGAGAYGGPAAAHAAFAGGGGGLGGGGGPAAAAAAFRQAGTRDEPLHVTTVVSPREQLASFLRSLLFAGVLVRRSPPLDLSTPPFLPAR